MRLLLTDRFCARATARSAQTDYFDETVKGLALRVGVKRKAWTLHLTINGRRSRLSLGSYPARVARWRQSQSTCTMPRLSGIDPSAPGHLQGDLGGVPAARHDTDQGLAPKCA